MSKIQASDREKLSPKFAILFIKTYRSKSGEVDRLPGLVLQGENLHHRHALCVNSSVTISRLIIKFCAKCLGIEVNRLW